MRHHSKKKIKKIVKLFAVVVTGILRIFFSFFPQKCILLVLSGKVILMNTTICVFMKKEEKMFNP